MILRIPWMAPDARQQRWRPTVIKNGIHHIWASPAIVLPTMVIKLFQIPLVDGGVDPIINGMENHRWETLGRWPPVGRRRSEKTACCPTCPT